MASTDNEDYVKQGAASLLALLAAPSTALGGSKFLSLKGMCDCLHSSGREILRQLVTGCNLGAIARLYWLLTLLVALVSSSGCSTLDEHCSSPGRQDIEDVCKAGWITMAVLAAGAVAIGTYNVVSETGDASDNKTNESPSECEPVFATHPSTAFLYGQGRTAQTKGQSQCKMIRNQIVDKEVFYAIHRNDRIADLLNQQSTGEMGEKCLSEIVTIFGDMSDTAKFIEYLDPDTGELEFDHVTDRELRDLLSHPVSRVPQKGSTKPAMLTKWVYDKKSNSWNCAVFGWNKNGKEVQISPPVKKPAPEGLSLDKKEMQQNYDNVKSAWESDILFEASWIHEMRHMDQCRTFKGLGTISDTLLGEVEAYHVEITYLQEQERLHCR